MRHCDLVVIGGGPAGMAAAVEAVKNGVRDILIMERESGLGGILQQCIHNGFGLHMFGEELTGPEYAWKYIDRIHEMGIPYCLDTTVLHMGADRTVTAVNGRDGVFTVQASAIVLAMGCRERPRGMLNIAGSRPAGIFTAGTAQKYVNIYGCLPGKSVVILGSGDIGLIMARRMTLEGAVVKMVCELQSYPGGLNRNIVQCLDDFGIPLKLSHTVIEIHGRERLEGVTVARVDSNRKPIPDTAEYVPCDTLLLSVGLIPENELSREAGIEIDETTSGPVVNQSMETSIQGIFACGNTVHVHDLVDVVSQEGAQAGENAAKYILEGVGADKKPVIRIKAGQGIRYTVPQFIEGSSGQGKVKLFFRVSAVRRDVKITVKRGEETIYQCHKAKVVPGEMVSLELSDVELGLAGGDGEAVVALEPKEG